MKKKYHPWLFALFLFVALVPAGEKRRPVLQQTVQFIAGKIYATFRWSTNGNAQLAFAPLVLSTNTPFTPVPGPYLVEGTNYVHSTEVGGSNVFFGLIKP